ncbi:DUF2577 family protein [Paenibacillus arenosi]|uniref:DUF2577 family protein n=1 Tax=Paenibacillus arenosi TaxID=2774142 RepID=A0ABR9B301_9BACL|nr:DUF2577 family protein [Paenibacillus arenosi]MBD8500746.1 DUF2577 family protein [Paenibacillus arenosi]
MSQWSWLVDYIREQGAKLNPPTMLIGEVTASIPNFKVKVMGLELDRDELWIADSLQGRELLVGEKVAVMPLVDNQQFVVLCRVVRP